MNKNVRGLLILFGVGCVVFVLWKASMAWLLGRALGCSVTEIGRSISPDSRHAALLVEYECGATTSNALGVFVVDGDTLRIPEASNVVAVADLGSRVNLRWRSSIELEIDSTQASGFEQRQATKDGIKIVLAQ